MRASFEGTLHPNSALSREGRASMTSTSPAYRADSFPSSGLYVTAAEWPEHLGLEGLLAWQIEDDALAPPCRRDMLPKQGALHVRESAVVELNRGHFGWLLRSFSDVESARTGLLRAALSSFLRKMNTNRTCRIQSDSYTRALSPPQMASRNGEVLSSTGLRKVESRVRMRVGNRTP